MENKLYPNIDISKVPLREKGWETANMRLMRVGGCASMHLKRIQAMYDKLIDDVSKKHEDWSPKDVREHVETYFIGLRRSPKGPPALATSPEVQHMLDASQLKTLPADWEMISKWQKKVGASQHFKVEYTKVIDQLADEIVEQHLRKIPSTKATSSHLKEAYELIDYNLAGKRQGITGNPGLAMNSIIAEMLASELIRKGKIRDPALANELSRDLSFKDR